MKQKKISVTLAIFVFIALSFSWIALAQMESSSLPGDPKQGWRVFCAKKCIDCHSVWGEGGKTGPDLGRAPATDLSAIGLVGAMWNHAAKMWDRMSQEKITSIRMEQKEMKNLFGFLYYIRFMNEPGNPERGMSLLREKKCISCHAIRGKGEKIGADLVSWGTYTNPILWVQRMWNHGTQMKEEMDRKGIAWPEFTPDEMVDLITYIRSVNKSGENLEFFLGNPDSGKALFSQKGCARCHKIGGKGKKIDLCKQYCTSLAELAGSMWNHSYQMWQKMKELKLEPPQLTQQEMTDLVTYICSARFYDQPGDSKRGQGVFSEKRCNFCHTQSEDALGPDLTPLKGKITPVYLACILWEHGPPMLKRMREEGLVWPTFTQNEMADLIEYLNSGLAEQ